MALREIPRVLYRSLFMCSSYPELIINTCLLTSIKYIQTGIHVLAEDLVSDRYVFVDVYAYENTVELLMQLKI